MRRLSNYFIRHFQAAIYSLGQFSRAPISSFVTCLIIGIALALPTSLLVGLKNFMHLQGSLEQTVQMTVYLKENIKLADVTKLSNTLKADPEVLNVKVISPDEGLKELQEQIGFEGQTIKLPQNPLPWSLVVSPKSTRALSGLSHAVQRLPIVDSVELDEIWVKRLLSLISVSLKIVGALAFFLCIAVLLIINNTIRTATEHNQKEIEIIQLIGGTSSFIRRPFLYAGMLYGLLGGILAWQLVDLLVLFLKKPTTHLASLYNSAFEIMGLGLGNTLILLSLSILLGFFGSYLAVSRHLKNS